MTELLQTHNKTFGNEELLLMDEQRKRFFEMESAPSQDAVKIVEMMAKYLEYYINLVDKAVPGFQSIDFSFERRSTVGKSPPTAKHATEKLFVKGKVN